jgi:hypothetical protein
VKRKYVPRDVYLAEYGVYKYVAQKISRIFVNYPVKDWTRKRIYDHLKENGYWHSRSGEMRITRIPQIDFLPPKWSKDYLKSLPDLPKKNTTSETSSREG